MKFIELNTDYVDRNRIYTYDENILSIHIDDMIVFRSDTRGRLFVVNVLEAYREGIENYDDVKYATEILASLRLDNFKKFCIDNDINYHKIITLVNLYQVHSDMLCVKVRHPITDNKLTSFMNRPELEDIVCDILSNIGKFSICNIHQEYFAFIASYDELGDMDSVDICYYEGKKVYIYSKIITNLLYGKLIDNDGDIILNIDMFDYDSNLNRLLIDKYDNKVQHGNDELSFMKDNPDFVNYNCFGTYHYEDDIFEDYNDIIHEEYQSIISKDCDIFEVFKVSDVTSYLPTELQKYVSGRLSYVCKLTVLILGYKTNIEDFSTKYSRKILIS
jgi:hypothetical protein